MNISFETSTIVNGPLNLVRLENDKVIYLFFDQHVYNSKCGEKYGLDIRQYLVKELNLAKKLNPNITYDLFLESLVNRIIAPTSVKGENYMREITALYWNKIQIEDPGNINKVEDNLRLHFIDIREYYMGRIYEFISSIDENRKDLINNTKEAIHNINILFNVRDTVKNFHKENIKAPKISNYLVKILKSKIVPSKTERLHIFTKLIYKLYYSYSDKNNQEIISRELDNIFDEIELLLDTTKELLFNLEHKGACISLTMTKEYKKDNLKINEFSNKLNYIYINIISSIMDLYTVRRLVDKKYVTNALVYVGAIHSNSIIYYLVKYFNYDITNYFKSNVKDLDDLNILIRSRYDKFDIDKNFFSKSQCINMIDFPRYFL